MAKDDIRENRLAKLAALREAGADPYGGRFETDGSLDALLQKLLAAEEAAPEGEEPEPVPVRAAGRIVAVRDMGKSIWLDLRDRSLEKLQVNILKKRCPDIFPLFAHVDIGDFLGVEGGLERSRRGEPTIFADTFRILCKSVEPLPEKWHGLKQVETRYRRRSLDLVGNRESLDVFVLRSRIIAGVRDFFRERDFLEVETPMLQSIYGGAAARPFVTHHNALDIDLFLRISPECYLKRLLVGGMDKVFEINRNFRNEGIDTTHNPEFTMLEVYEAYADFSVMMEYTETLVSGLAAELLGSTSVPWGEETVDLAPPWRRARFKDLVAEICGVDPDDADACRARLSETLSRRGADEKDVDVRKKIEAATSSLDHDHVLDVLFAEEVEPTLVQPVFVTHHPAGLTPLCRANAEDPSVHDRFEPFVCGFELGNAYSEQNDPVVQRETFERQLADAPEGESYANALDEDFLRALEIGMPPAGGLGIGIDRLVMLLTNRRSIREVVLFPTLKPKSRAEQEAEEAAETESADEDADSGDDG